MLNEQTNRNGTGIIDEDREVLESIQQAIKVADGLGRIGRSEQRIHAFHRHYLELMGETTALPQVDQVVPAMPKASATGR
jgi:hypothetical protein